MSIPQTAAPFPQHIFENQFIFKKTVPNDPIPTSWKEHQTNFMFQHKFPISRKEKAPVKKISIDFITTPENH